jgi:hypothetical protein
MRRIGDVVNLIEDLNMKNYDEYAKENSLDRELAEVEVDSKVDALTELLEFYNDFKNLVSDEELSVKFKCQFEILHWFLKPEQPKPEQPNDLGISIDGAVFHKHTKGEFV